jgi:hypothetical protein
VGFVEVFTPKIEMSSTASACAFVTVVPADTE